MNTVYDAIVVGSGAAGYNAAIRLCQGGLGRVALITEHIRAGTSRNTGSDKQTYYKLGLGGDAPDSVRQMAENLFAGGCVDGDNALCEAALSTRCFLNLCELGVPFPHNRYGEYVGYKTDHDPYARATSAGPLTSKFMTEALQKTAESLPIAVLDHLQAVELLKDSAGILGLLCLDNRTGQLTAFACGNIVLATGGPAGIYADSVYPESQTGSTGLAIEAGATLQNLTEWQYGLASVKPRWNVSGTYMQVLPRFVSLDSDGTEHEFLSEFFTDPYEALSTVFLKGYQWPFDCNKVLSGSSVIDLLVYRECVSRGRRVFLDFTKNPFSLAQIDYSRLSDEAHTYLRRAEACFGTPIQRLEKMNAPAIELYRSKGVDIASEYLQIALCAQHHNGGIAVDLWWQTDVPGLFAAGECAGTHGITRPGGSALNAGQVGSLRAAQYICAHPRQADLSAFAPAAEEALARHRAFCARILENPDNVTAAITAARRNMSDRGGAIRSAEALSAGLEQTETLLTRFREQIGTAGPEMLYKAYQLKDILTVQQALLRAMLDYETTVGRTRGSALIYDAAGALRTGLPEDFRLRTEGASASDRVQQLRRTETGFCITWRSVRPIPAGDDFFENIWRRFRTDQNIY